MVRRSWQSIISDPNAQESAGKKAPQVKRPQSLEEAAEQSGDTRLSALLRARRQLESHMADLTGQGQEPREDPRFPVLSFAERQAQQRQWEAQRQDHRNSESEFYRSLRDRTTHSVMGFRQTPLEQRLTGSDISRRLKDSEPATALHRINDSTRLEQVQNMLRQDTEPVKTVKRGLNSIRRPVEQYSADLKRLDNELENRDVSADDRAEIQELLKSKEVARVSSALDRADNLLDAPKRAADKIESSWLNRRRQIDGPMDRIGQYADRSRRRLSTSEGGSGDLFERNARARIRALRRRREQKRQEEADQARRDRALEKRREKEREYE